MSADSISKLTSATAALCSRKRREELEKVHEVTSFGLSQETHKSFTKKSTVRETLNNSNITLQSTLMWAIKTWLIPYASCKLWHGTSLDNFFFHHWTQQWPDWSDRATEWGNSAGRASADIEPFCCHLHIIILCRISRHPASCVLLWSEW